MTIPQADLNLISLSAAVERFGRAAVAKAIGCTGPALANAIRVKRVIMVRVVGDNLLYALEISSFPSKGFCVKRPRGTLPLQSDISSILKKERDYQERTAVQTDQPHIPTILLSG